MVNRAIITKDNYAVCADSHKILPYEEYVYPATLSAFVLSRKKDIIGGTIYLDDAPSDNGALAIIDAELKKVVYKQAASTPTQIAAIQLLEQAGVETCYNPEIQL